ncbi:hypothetical protein [Natronospora cellulosivora (SeqCode)]
MLETIEIRLEFIRMLTFIPAGIFAILGFYIVVKRSYNEANNKIMYFLKVLLIILALLSPFIVMWLTEAP